jgi:hypothetical protein
VIIVGACELAEEAEPNSCPFFVLVLSRRVASAKVGYEKVSCGVHAVQHDAQISINVVEVVETCT